MEVQKNHSLCKNYYILRDPASKKLTRPPLGIRYNKETNYMSVTFNRHFRPAAYSGKTIGCEIAKAIDDFYKSDDKLAYLDSRRSYEEDNIVTFAVITNDEEPKEYTRNGYPFAPPTGSVERAKALTPEEKTALLVSREKVRLERIKERALHRQYTKEAKSAKPGTGKSKILSRAQFARRGDRPQLVIPRVIYPPGGGSFLLTAEQASWDEPTEKPSHTQTSEAPAPAPPTSDGADTCTTDSTSAEDSDSTEAGFDVINDLLYDGGSADDYLLEDVDEALLQGEVADIQGKHPGAESPCIATIAETKEDPLEAQMAEAVRPLDSEAPFAPKAKGTSAGGQTKGDGTANAPDSGKSSNRKVDKARTDKPKPQARVAATPPPRTQKGGTGGARPENRVFKYTPQTLGQQKKGAKQQQPPRQSSKQQQPQRQQPKGPTDRTFSKQRHVSERGSKSPRQTEAREVPAAEEVPPPTQQEPGQKAQPDTVHTGQEAPTPTNTARLEGGPQRATEGGQEVGNRPPTPPKNTSASVPTDRKGSHQVGEKPAAPTKDTSATVAATSAKDTSATVPATNEGRSEEDPEEVARRLIRENDITVRILREACRNVDGSVNIRDLTSMVTKVATSNYNTCEWPPE